MTTPPGIRLGLLARVGGALCAVLISLACLAFLAVRSTREATHGADRIEAEFAERVTSGRALSTAFDNVSLAERRMRATRPVTVRAHELALTRSDATLAAQIRETLGDSVDEPDEADEAETIEQAFQRYLRVRNELLRDPAGRGTGESNVAALDRAFEPLQASLQSYADGNYLQAQQDLAHLRSGGRDRNLALAAVLAFGLLSLLSIVLVARGIVRRVREYVSFAGDVAAGDLDARLEPRGRDELAALAGSLNAMVGQLSASSVQRETSHGDEAAYRLAQHAFSEILQVTETESEAHEILKLHIERSVPESHVVILNRNNSKDRLEASIPLPEGSPLAETLQTTEPRSCLAVRLARPYTSGRDSAPLLDCQVCGASAKRSTCLPLLVSGEVIGSVLVEHEQALDARAERCVKESIAQAAPILANLRNLAFAEARAATDSLTGLPNRRAVEETLKRMIAHASRTTSPMTAILLDLDHFKQINDTFGHEEGDAVLASVGDALTASVRTSDFVGRTGGEEFIALLPDTDAEGALETAEKLRARISEIKVSRNGKSISASFGVAVHPDVAHDAPTLMRLADRALYAAKAGGRNRVHLATVSSLVGVGLELEEIHELDTVSTA